jgi:hypothetical protein
VAARDDGAPAAHGGGGAPAALNRHQRSVVQSLGPAVATVFAMGPPAPYASRPFQHRPWALGEPFLYHQCKFGRPKQYGPRPQLVPKAKGRPKASPA